MHYSLYTARTCQQLQFLIFLIEQLQKQNKIFFPCSHLWYSFYKQWFPHQPLFFSLWKLRKIIKQKNIYIQVFIFKKHQSMNSSVLKTLWGKERPDTGEIMSAYIKPSNKVIIFIFDLYHFSILAYYTTTPLSYRGEKMGSPLQCHHSPLGAAA